MKNLGLYLHEALCYVGIHHPQEHRRGPRHAEPWTSCGVCGKEENVVTIAKPEATAPLFEEKA